MVIKGHLTPKKASNCNVNSPSIKPDEPPEQGYFCIAGLRGGYGNTGCTGGFYPECKGKNRWYSCSGLRSMGI